MKSIYVFGLFESSPGKTTVATALLKGLNQRGIDIAPIKPRSGHNLWYQFDSYSKCKEEGRLYCEDIIKLKKASGCKLPYEILNPLDTLIAPLYAGWFLRSELTRELYLKHSDEFTRFILERYTISYKEGYKSIFCFNETDESKVLRDEEYINSVLKGQKVYRVKNLKEWTKIYNKYAKRAVCSCVDRVKSEHKNILVESFSDEVFAIPEMEYDVAIGVGPGLASLYPSERIEKVLDIKNRGGPLNTVKAPNILSFMKPEKIVDIPPLSSQQLKDYGFLSKSLEELVEAVLRKI